MAFLFYPVQGSKFETLSEEEVLRRHNVDKERQIARTEKMNKKREKKKQKNGNSNLQHFSLSVSHDLNKTKVWLQF